MSCSQIVSGVLKAADGANVYAAVAHQLGTQEGFRSAGTPPPSIM